MKGLKALCWMFGLPALVCGGGFAWYLVHPLKTGDAAVIAPGSWVAWTENDLREAESYIVADDQWGNRRLLDLEIQRKGGWTDLKRSVSVTILAISSDRRVAEIKIHDPRDHEDRRAFTFLDRLR